MNIQNNYAAFCLITYSSIVIQYCNDMIGKRRCRSSSQHVCNVEMLTLTCNMKINFTCLLTPF